MTFADAVKYFIDTCGIDLSKTRPTVDDLNKAVAACKGGSAATLNAAIAAGRIILRHWVDDVPVSRQEAVYFFAQFGDVDTHDTAKMLDLCNKAVFVGQQPVESVQCFMRALYP